MSSAVSRVARAPATSTIGDVDHRRLQRWLFATQLVGAATLLRSVAYDRWITVLAAVLLMVGATAARRGRSWGVGLALAAAAAFPVAFAIGIAPPWFVLVGLVGAMPFAIASRAFARFDKGATVLLAALAGSAGAIGAIAWKEYAWSIFQSFPLSRPSIEAQHGLALTALTALTVVAGVAMRSKSDGGGGGTRMRIAEHVRVADGADSAEEEEALVDPLEEEPSALHREAATLRNTRS
jgi:hypothetical protein